LTSSTASAFASPVSFVCGFGSGASAASAALASSAAGAACKQKQHALDIHPTTEKQLKNNHHKKNPPRKSGTKTDKTHLQACGMLWAAKQHVMTHQTHPQFWMLQSRIKKAPEPKQLWVMPVVPALLLGSFLCLFMALLLIPFRVL
jgi:hypothetical protein